MASKLALRNSNAAFSTVAASTVGVGTAAPQGILHVQGTSSTGDRTNSLVVQTQRAGILLSSLAAGGTQWNLWTSVTGDASGAGTLVFYDNTNGANRMVLNATGNIGIGSNTPQYKLDVAGSINVTGGFYVNGSAFSGGGSSQWSTNGSNIYYSGGNVGIGISAASAATNSLWISAAGTATNTVNQLYLQNFNTPNSTMMFSVTSTASYIQSYLQGTGTQSLVLQSRGGNVGIGTTPQYSMDIVGSVNVTGGVYVNGSLLTTGGGIILPNTTGLAANTWTTTNGINWTSSCSPSAASGAYYAFNNNTGYANNWLGQLSPYGMYNSGTYIGSASTTILGGIGAIAGEWIQIQSSIPITLYSYIPGVGSWQAQPKAFYIVGSNDGTNWYPLALHVFATNPFTTDFTKGSTSILMNFTGTQSVTANTTQNLTSTSYSYTTQTFSYFRFIINSNFLTWQDCGQIGELYLTFLAPSASSVSPQWSANGSNIYYNTGQVGINTTSPLAALDVSGTFRVLSQSYTALASGTGVDILYASGGQLSSGTRTTGVLAASTMSYAASAHTFYAGSLGAATALTIASSGSVGIGTASPAYSFDMPSGAMAVWNRLLGSSPTNDYFWMGLRGSASEGGRVAIGIKGDPTTGQTSAIQFNVNGNGAMTINSSQQIGIGTASPAALLHVNGGNVRLDGGDTLLGWTSYASTSYNDPGYNMVQGIALRQVSNGCSVMCATTYIPFVATKYGTAQTNNMMTFFYSSAVGQSVTTIGTITHTSSAVAYNTSSDARLKENIQDVSNIRGMVDLLRPRTFQFVRDDDKEMHVGFIAQEVRENFPQYVAGKETDTDYLGMDYGKMSPFAISACKDLYAITDVQSERIAALQAKNDALESQMAALQRSLEAMTVKLGM